MNGSGRTPAELTHEKALHVADVDTGLPLSHPHTVSVPGAAAGWCDALSRWGTRSIAEVLQPAISLAEEGFPVHPVAAAAWADGAHLLTADRNPSVGTHTRSALELFFSCSDIPLAALRRGGAALLMPDGKAPKAGDMMRMPELANTFRELAAHGKAGFYTGRVAEAIVATLRELGGVMTTEDLASHVSTFEDPISTTYRGHEVFEIAPNGQGLTALMALNILEGFDLAAHRHNSPEYLHLLIEALRLSFADTMYHVTDRDHYPESTCSRLLMPRIMSPCGTGVCFKQRYIRRELTTVLAIMCAAFSFVAQCHSRDCSPNPTRLPDALRSNRTALLSMPNVDPPRTTLIRCTSQSSTMMGTLVRSSTQTTWGSALG